MRIRNGTGVEAQTTPASMEPRLRSYCAHRWLSEKATTALICFLAEQLELPRHAIRAETRPRSRFSQSILNNVSEFGPDGLVAFALAAVADGLRRYRDKITLRVRADC